MNEHKSSATWQQGMPKNSQHMRIGAIPLYLILGFLRTYYDNARWRLCEMTSGDWTFEGSKAMNDIVHAFVKGIQFCTDYAHKAASPNAAYTDERKEHV